MKKPKLDLASIKRWLFEHGEKLAFGIMVVVFMLFAYSAAKREVLDDSKQPEQLKSKADNVTRHVAESQWDPKNPDVQIVDYQGRTKRDVILAENYALAKSLNTPIADDKGKREDPEIFNVEQLRVRAGMAPFAYKGQGGAASSSDNKPVARGEVRGPGRGFAPSSGSKLEPQPWAVITALVPIEKQAAEFARLFASAAGENPERDTPHYAGKSVERAEIDEKQPDKLDWKPLTAFTTLEQRWEAAAGEIVDTRFVDPALTDPLGPRVGEEWDDTISHPGLVVVGATSTPAPAAAAPVSEGDDAPPPANSGLMRGRVAPAPVAAAPTASPQAERITHKLLRVFDYSVKPNKKYRYRVKLGLDNPNYGVHPRHLKNPAAPENKQQIRLAAEWSEPSEVVTIPAGYGVLAGNVESSRDPWAKVLLTAIKDDGVVAAAEVRVQRGTVANKREKVEAIDPRDGSRQPAAFVDFNTNTVVVDIFGGKLVSGPKRRTESPLAAPGEVLLLDAGGNLVVHNDIDDLSTYEYRLPPKPEPVEDSDDKKKDKESSKKGDADEPAGRRKAGSSTTRADR